MYSINLTNNIANDTPIDQYLKGDEASQWKRPKFDPSPHQNPVTDLHKNWQA